MKSLYIILLTFLLLDGCLDPLNVPLRETPPVVVVDGLLTDEPGIQTVKLFYSTGLDKTIKRPIEINNAKVEIIDDLVHIETLFQTASGVYQTQGNKFYARQERTYKLRITMANQHVYESAFQKLNPAGDIDRIYQSFESEGLVSNNGSPQDILNLYIDAHGVEGAPNLFRWRWSYVYEVKTFPELRMKFEGLKRVPDPEICSGYVRSGDGIAKESECTCCVCWSYNYSNTSVVSEKNFSHDGVFNKINVGQILVTSMKFYDKLYIEVEQLSLADEAFKFWKLVEAQQKATGNLFQPNSVKIRGNMYNVSEPNEEVLGIFAVSGIRRKSIFIDRTAIPYVLDLIDTIGYDCRKAFINATIEKPPFW
jgi:hypothetical protein